MPAPALLALLSATGYEVCFRSAAWVECLVLREDERWIGNGLSEDAALDDAVARMLPSHVARTLLVRATAAQPDGEARAHVDQLEPVPIAEPHVDEHVTTSVEPASAATDRSTSIAGASVCRATKRWLRSTTSPAASTSSSPRSRDSAGAHNVRTNDATRARPARYAQTTPQRRATASR